MTASNPQLWIKRGNEDEIDVGTITSDLDFLGESTSPTISNVYQDNVGNDGSILNYQSFQKSVVTANFNLHFGDWMDFKLAQHDIYRFFMNKELMRIRTDMEPAIVKYVRAGNFDVKPISDGSNDASFSIPFDNPSGYKYSLANSDQLKTYDQGVWMLYGGNIPMQDDINYHFVDQRTLKVYNASDITVDPYFQRHELKIIMKHYGGSFGLVNNTTGTSWNFKGQMNNADTLLLNGINTFKNGTLDNNETDYGYLSLAPGWNEISVVGAGDLDITFSFPFIYLA
ncbi:phage tail family protein [Liquorilactobacillus satsumensis]|uniref:phage tail family protein n=1 Tax=Lactobacillaceae TaxID=33958 RepID=UPI0021C43AAF|nr:phage tail family protein [Liquorilactobacillus satsumensis]MCP9313701.1 phage tail family protein [Liquorilactobacillus satsumensis]MCP9360842.1 phage tail family protein [Liquorilactobacillus satsumensis]